MLGTTLLNYRVLSQLGAGGLGTVYLAEHTVIGRKAALKVLHPSVSHDVDMVTRFVAEARAANTIRHPNIVDVTDYGQANGCFVIVMELLEGETVAQRLDRTPRLTSAQVVALLTQAASALGAAHERGIVHRDVKPENLFLTNAPDYPDFLKVLDFGIAKLMGVSDGPHTKPGMIIGTPATMSPEQVLGDVHLDARSDIYSLGVVAYRMLTGRLPFDGSAMQLMQAHLREPAPRLRDLEPSIDEKLEVIVLKCLSKAKEARFASMKELRRALFSLGRAEPLEREKPSALETSGAPPSQAVPQAIPPVSDPGHPRESGHSLQEQTAAVAIAARLKDIIQKRLQSNTLRLPALPEIAMQCLELVQNPDTSFAVLARLIEKDPFIATRVIRLSNSPVYGGLARVGTVEGAVSRIGTKTLIGALQELAAEQVFISKDPAIRNAFRGIWEHCLGVATLARELCRHMPAIDPNAAYLAGLFHDIGKPVVAALLLEVERSATRPELLSSGVWRRVVEECHREVGATIAYRWYLPLEVAQTIAQLETFNLKQGRCASNVVRLSNGLCQREGLDIKSSDAEATTNVIVTGRRLLRLTEEQVEHTVVGITGRVHALTQQNANPETSATRVFDRAG